MTKSEIAKSMKTYLGTGFITRDQLREFMGYKSCTSIDKYLSGLAQVGKKYLVEDVAERLVEAKEYR